jgi:hypothetical protein
VGNDFPKKSAKKTMNHGCVWIVWLSKMGKLHYLGAERFPPAKSLQTGVLCVNAHASPFDA